MVVCVEKSKRTVENRDDVGGRKRGLLPLAALIPAGKVAVLGGVSGAAGYGVKKGLEAALSKCQR